jgi:ribosomal protein S18 acetylase RimI-like enzyme
MDLTLKPMSESYAKEICSWKYDGEYSIYNMPDWNTVVEKGWGLSQKERRSEFIALVSDSQLIAFGRLSLKDDLVFIGVGLKPELCGMGYGRKVMNVIVEECKRIYPDKKAALRVRSFNKRAVRCYESIGFEIKKVEHETVYSGSEEFYYMEYKEKDIV